MKHTNQQTTTKTLADLYRSLDRRTAVTITYLKPGEAEPTVRTIEVHEIRTTRAGGIVIVAMCRLRGEERQFHLSGVLAYTTHRIAYVLDRPEPTKYVRPTPAPTTDAQALFFYELARDQDDADYIPRILIQADTSLAA
ncbi:WYL domain-containing protein [Streptomyces sp. ML-6]|uniref:WYL domain-containing protein n=1 Tax=Streptomyces sp. ML-6 TaxID=2982693 RepID=UPI0024BF18DB|nr:WYL domain-containing protein [Streptomyces sp. ML-6]MDK0525034.1 WYL domain-containing protein [Streptomyces sp. ML-6]